MFEAHITIEPVFGERLLEAQKLVAQHRFRLADLLMKKRLEDTPERSQYDTFATAKSESYPYLLDRMKAAVQDLRRFGFAVWRYKIEATLMDSRDGDSLGLLQ